MTRAQSIVFWVNFGFVLIMSAAMVWAFFDWDDRKAYVALTFIPNLILMAVRRTVWPNGPSS